MKEIIMKMIGMVLLSLLGFIILECSRRFFKICPWMTAFAALLSFLVSVLVGYLTLLLAKCQNLKVVPMCAGAHRPHSPGTCAITICMAVYISLRGKMLGMKKGPAVVAPGFAQSFSSMLIDACRRTHAKLDDKYVLRTKLDKAVCDYKKQQKLHEKDVFHYRTIFVLFPDLREFIDSDNPESCLLAGLEDLEDMKQPEFYAGKSISIPYERSGALRESNYSVLVLNTKLPDGQEKRDYFLCMDNRPLVTLLDWHDYNRKKGGSGIDICVEQDTYREELKKCLDADKLSKETYIILEFKGRLSVALKKYLSMKLKREP